jgi:hypothetical protein
MGAKHARYPKLMTSRLLSVASAVVLFASTTATGLNSMGSMLSEAMSQIGRKPHGNYTENPTAPYLGKHRRDLRHRAHGCYAVAGWKARVLAEY